MPSSSPVQDRVASRRGCCMNQVLPMTRILELASGLKPKRKATPARSRIVCQLWRAAEKQVEQVEARLETLSDEPQALEREAKTLGIIARTVRELVALDEEKAKLKNRGKGESTDDSRSPPMSIPAFRRELAEKLEQLRLERAGGGASGETLATGD